MDLDLNIEESVWESLKKIVHDTYQKTDEISPELKDIFEQILDKSPHKAFSGFKDDEGNPIYEGDIIIKSYPLENLDIEASVFYDTYHSVFAVRYEYDGRESILRLKTFLANATSSTILKKD